jgi:hypothetical protein
LGEKLFYDEATGTQHSANLNDYLLVDCHLRYPTLRPDLEEGRGALTGRPGARHTGEANGSLMQVEYQFGPWKVLIYWPTRWLFRGTKYAPATNRFGLAPAGEFGVSDWTGGSSIRPLTKVEPFPYQTVGGNMYTPESAFVYGEKISPDHYRHAYKELGAGAAYWAAIAPIALADRK